MAVKRIVANIATSRREIDAVTAFYRDIFELEVAMDHGWIATLTCQATMITQLSIASEGGSATPVPDLSIEVDNLDEIQARLHDQGIALEYGPVTEPWCVRRFYVRDPVGKLLNVLEHV